MSYADFEYSAQNGDPVFRYQFDLDGEIYRRTSEANIVLDSAGSWMPSPITPSEFSQTNELAKDPLKLTMPRDDAFAELFIGGVPEQITTVTVFRGHQGDTAEEFRLYWKGRVVGVGQENDAVVLECENIFSSVKRPGLIERYQKTCRHALYHRGCNLNDYDFATIATATAISGKTITVEDADDSNTNLGYFTGGIIETESGERRYITKHDQSQITLLSPIASLTETLSDSASVATVTLYPGCDRSRTTCKEKFDNLDNYGGFSWIPSKNPFANSVTGSIA